MMAGLLIAAIFGTLFSALFSGLETGLYQINRIRLRLRAEREQDRSARVLLDLLSQPEALLATVLLGNNVANYLTTAAVSSLLAPFGEVGTVVLTTLVVTPLLFILGEVTPKNIFRRSPDLFCYPMARPVYWLRWALWPAVAALRSIGRSAGAFFHTPAKEESKVLTRSSLAYLLSESEETGTLSGAQGRLAENIVIRHRFRVRDLMTPIAEVESVDEDVTMEELLSRADNRTPDLIIVSRRRPTNVVGAFWLNDLIFTDQARRTENLSQFSQAAARVPEHWPIDQVLWFLQARRALIGVVVDRADEIEGVVTLPMLVERFCEDLASRQ
ncbi:MAG: CNNM domain-containing protein [Planctomycetota bacterium]